jgi:arginyl-tRNA synthetase
MNSGAHLVLIENIESDLTKAFKAAFADCPPDLKIEITRSTQAHFGHYQCNSAMKLSKPLKRAPREIAEVVTKKLAEITKPGIYEKIEVAGPGFINLALTPAYISEQAESLFESSFDALKTSHPIKTVMDFPSPNTAKEMHVGHLRSAIIGECLARILRFLGNDVLALNHIGDRGTAFGMLLAYIKQYEPKVLSGEKATDLTSLSQFYKAAKKQFDEDPTFKKQSQQEVVRLQESDPQTKQAWEVICEATRKGHQVVYDLLDIHVIERGESFYVPLIPEVMKDLESKKLITDSDGAKCMFIEGFENREGEPLPCILEKSDGGFNYSTTDLAAIRQRIESEKAKRILYVTDAGQSTHYGMVFGAAKKAGYLDESQVRAEHVPFGVVLGQDGKKFKTRSGETEKLIDLLDNAVQKAEEILIERNQSETKPMSPQEIKDIAKVLGINAIKYADLSGNRINDYVFSYDRMLRFEGNTAAFLMYAYVRIHGIKRKIQNPVIGKITLVHPSEVALGLHLCQFPEILYSIADDLMPNRLCDYLYELANKFNAFFRDCRVEGDSAQASRLALCELSEKILKKGFDLLGLRAVERM